MALSPHVTTIRRHHGVPALRHPAHTAAAQQSILGPGQARSRNARYGEITVTYLEHGSVRLAAPERAWGTDPQMLRLLVVVSGKVTLRHTEAAASLEPRDSALIMGTGPVGYSSTAGARVVLCDVPVEHAGLSNLVRSAPFAVGRADAAVPSALGSFLIDLLRQDPDRVGPLARAQVAEVLRTLATSTITVLAVAGNYGWELRRQRLAALRHIAARYTDPDLSSASVAEHLGLSRRSLQRLFEGEERTVAQHIQDVRTKHAISRLSDSRMATASLGEIATLSGFGSTVAMRRAVQDATGQTPSDLRRDMLAAANLPQDPVDLDEPPHPEAGA